MSTPLDWIVLRLELLKLKEMERMKLFWTEMNQNDRENLENNNDENEKKQEC